MIIFHLLLLFFTIIGSCLAAIDVKYIVGRFRNVHVLRTFDLSSSIIKENIGIHLKNTGSQATSSYYFTIPAHDRSFLSIYTAHNLQDPEVPLEIEPLGLDTTNKVEIFKIHLNEFLEPENEMKIGLDLAYTHWIRPLPEKIPQIARQYVTFTAGNIYFFSPYRSDDMKTTFIFPNSKIITYVGGEPNHVGQKIENHLIYGVYNNIPPFSFGASNFHYDYGDPILTMTGLKRELQVSHWGGNLAVTEDYALRNDGAQLLHGFSRLAFDYDREILANTNMQAGVLFHLHRRASNIQYTDMAGNISTSQVAYGRDSTVLATEFRYPSMGGWKNDWRIAYDVPSRYFLRYYNNRYILKFLFLENAHNATYDNVQVKVILPEGATDIQVKLPSIFNMSHVEHKTHYSYFDSTGRPAVIFFRSNVISAHEQPIMIFYKYSFIRLLQKPLVASLSIFMLCVLSILVAKVPWSLGENRENELEIENKEKNEFNDLERVVENVAIGKPQSYVKDVRNIINSKGNTNDGDDTQRTKE